MQKSLKDLLAGLIFIVFGASFAFAAWRYDLGTAIRMGPGMFPLLLGGILVLLGVLVVVEGMAAGEGGPIWAVPWRGFVLILGAVLFFGFFVRPLGLVPTLFVAVLLAAFSSTRTSVVAAVALALALTLFCTLIFVFGLGLPLPLFGPWLSSGGA